MLRNTEPNPYLSEIFGTLGGGYTQEDLEKVAAAEALEALAEENEVDLSELSDEEVAAILDEIANGEADTDPGEVPDEPMDKEAQQAIFDDAAFAGQVMAHAYTHEMDKIAAARQGGGGGSAIDQLAEQYAMSMLKEAGYDVDGEAEGEGELTLEDVAQFAQEVYGIDPEELTEEGVYAVAEVMEKDAGIRAAAGKVVEKVKNIPGWMKALPETTKQNLGVAGGRAAKRHEKAFRQLWEVGVKGKPYTKGMKGTPSAKTRLKAVGEAAKGVAPELGVAGGTAAAGGTGLFMAGRASKKEKRASVLEQAVHTRALQMLVDAGYELE
jgi:hypothetical protein